MKIVLKKGASDKNALINILICTIAFTSCLGAQFMAIDVGIALLSLYRICILVSFILLIVSRIGARHKILIWRKNNLFSVAFFFLWFLYAFVTVIWSNDFASWAKSIFFLGTACIAIILFNNYLLELSDFRIIIEMMAIGIFIQALIGVYEIVTKDYRFIGETEAYIYGFKSLYGNPVAMTGNPNNFGTLMHLGALLSLFCANVKKNPLSKMIYLIFAVTDVVLLFFSFSRACILGFILSVAFLLFMSRKNRIAIFTIMIFILIALPQTGEVIDNIFHSNVYDQASDNIRLNLIKNGVDFFLQTYGFGVGSGQVSYWLTNANLSWPTGGINVLHNWWVEILASYGVWIFSGFLAFYVKMFLSMLREAQRGVMISKSLALIICSFLVGYVVTSISSSSNFSNETMWCFFAFCIAFQGKLSYFDFPKCQIQLIKEKTQSES